MPLTAQECCVLNEGDGAWAFEPLAEQLSASLGIEVAAEPRRFNYLLQLEQPGQLNGLKVFIPLESLRLAADKRLLAAVFNQHGVPTPETRLCETFAEVLQFIRSHPDREWCLKYPTSCGANGHRLATETATEPPNWPRPFVLQEFVRLERPEVYRLYCAGGELFGWVARRFPEGVRSSPWVAHAQGARYASAGEPPSAACEAAQRALVATGLWDSFGCVDLLQKPSGQWVVLEVGTDGLFNHVDRDVGNAGLERELNERLAKAFWRAAHRQ